MSNRKQLILHYNWKLSGGFPEVPLNPNIDMAELEHLNGNEKPMFITLPVARNNLVAEDGFIYTEKVNDVLLKALQNDGITGNMGHIAEKDRATVYPMPVGIWVGATKDSEGTIWAKAYIRDEKFREFVRQLKATNSNISTSIYASYDPSTIQMGVDGNWEIDASTLLLEHLDFAPPTRAALQFERQFVITNHMSNDINENGDNLMDKATIISQMTVDEVPENLKKAIIGEYTSEKGTSDTLSQMTKDLNDANAIISQMREELTASTEELYEARLDQAINNAIELDDEALRDYVKTKVLSQLSSVALAERDTDRISSEIEKVTAQEIYKGLAAARVAHLSGGKITGNIGNRETTTDEDKLREEALNTDANMFRSAFRV